LAPSVKIVHLIDALSSGRNVQIEVTGIRPGEKVHEVVITQEEAARTTRIGDFFHLAPLLPDFIRRAASNESSPVPGAVTSDEDVLDLPATHQLVRSFLAEAVPI
jgi:UDP-glucose 4-epimerase